MSHLGNGNRGAAYALIAAAATTLVGSQMIFLALFSGPSVAFAETTDVIDEHVHPGVHWQGLWQQTGGGAPELASR